jgi:glycosyltransferase involved in cell wall biosynthesis
LRDDHGVGSNGVVASLRTHPVRVCLRVLTSSSTPSQPPEDRGGADLSGLVASSGLRRVHVLAWRDLDDAEAGGSELHADAIMRRWAAAGVEVTMCTSTAPGEPADVRRNGYRVMRTGGRFDVFPRVIVDELRGRHGRRDALVEIWNGVPWVSPVWARGPRVTWLHHVHGPMWKQVLPPGIAHAGELTERRLAPPFYRRTRMITLSESSKHEMVHQQGFKPEQVVVIPPGVHERFVPDASGAPPTRSPHPMVVAVGRLMPVKQFDALIRAVAPLRAKHPDLELVIVGDGEERSKLDAVVGELDAASLVRFTGRVSDDELAALYRQAWVLSSASVAEGWGMTITEAAACGTPAVVTDIGGHRDAVAADRSGVLAAPAHLGPAIGRVLDDVALRTQLAAGALEHAQRFSWDATAFATFHELALDAERRRR